MSDGWVDDKRDKRLKQSYIAASKVENGQKPGRNANLSRQRTSIRCRFKSRESIRSRKKIQQKTKTYGVQGVPSGRATGLGWL